MESCNCGGPITMILACSGGSNVGQISNEVARRLTLENKGAMFCLAGMGGDIAPLVERTKSPERVLVIDGCPVACAKKTLERHGIEHEWLELTAAGIEKSANLELAEDEIQTAKDAAEEMLGF
ncbi:MAG TPA: zinc-binding protein [Armatimonadetes bacterium]|nr:zinc-binding protein [Armatimonadota bacterium]